MTIIYHACMSMSTQKNTEFAKKCVDKLNRRMYYVYINTNARVRRHGATRGGDKNADAEREENNREAGPHDAEHGRYAKSAALCLYGRTSDGTGEQRRVRRLYLPSLPFLALPECLSTIARTSADTGQENGRERDFADWHRIDAQGDHCPGV